MLSMYKLWQNVEVVGTFMKHIEQLYGAGIILINGKYVGDRKCKSCRKI